jgi:hypothetical protein
MKARSTDSSAIWKEAVARNIARQLLAQLGAQADTCDIEKHNVVDQSDVNRSNFPPSDDPHRRIEIRWYFQSSGEVIGRA